jgi:hypothetical protein
VSNANGKSLARSSSTHPTASLNEKFIGVNVLARHFTPRNTYLSYVAIPRYQEDTEWVSACSCDQIRASAYLIDQELEKLASATVSYEDSSPKVRSELRLDHLPLDAFYHHLEVRKLTADERNWLVLTAQKAGLRKHLNTVEQWEQNDEDVQEQLRSTWETRWAKMLPSQRYTELLGDRWVVVAGWTADEDKLAQRKEKTAKRNTLEDAQLRRATLS